MKRKTIIFVMILAMTSSMLIAKVLDEQAPIGSRKNPVQIRTSITTPIMENGVEIAIATLAVNGVMRGVLAEIYLALLEIAYGENIPAIKDETRKEYMLVVFSVQNIKDSTGQDLPFYVGHHELMLANQNYVARTPARVAHIDSELDGYMYEGSSHAGFLLYEVNIGEEYYLVYQNKWFELGTETDEKTITSILSMKQDS